MCPVPEAPPPRPASAPPGCGRLTVKTPTCAIIPRAVPHPGPLSSQPAPCPHPPASWPSSCCGRCQGRVSGRPLTSASLCFLSLVLEKVVCSISAASSPGARACLRVPGRWPGRAGEGASVGHSVPNREPEGLDAPGRKGAAQGLAVGQGPQHFPPLVPTQLQTQVCRPPREAAGRAAASQVHAHAHPCSPPAQAHLRVQGLPGRGAGPCSWFVGLWARWASARPKWLQPGSQELLRQHAAPSWAPGINGASTLSLGSAGPGPRGRGRPRGQVRFLRILLAGTCQAAPPGGLCFWSL